MHLNIQNNQQIHALTDPNLFNHILSFCDHQTQQSSIPLVSKLWLEAAKGINQANFQNNPIPNQLSGTITSSPRLLGHIFSFCDPLTRQKTLPKVAKSWETTVRCTCQSTEDKREFKQTCRDLIDYKISGFRHSGMYGLPSWWNSQLIIVDYLQSIASSLHGKIQKHHSFVPYTKEQAEYYLSAMNTWDRVIIRPDEGRSDRCILSYYDSRAREIVEHGIKLDYANNCFTLIKYEEIDNQTLEVECESFEKVKYLVNYMHDRINEGMNIKPGEIIYSEDSNTLAWPEEPVDFPSSEESEVIPSDEDLETEVITSDEDLESEVIPSDGDLESFEEEPLGLKSQRIERLNTVLQEVSQKEAENIKNLEIYLRAKLDQFRKK